MLVDERNLMFMLYVNIEQKYIYKYKWLRNVRKHMKALHTEVLNTTICCIISPNAVHTADFKNLLSYHISSVFNAIKRTAIIVMRHIYTKILKSYYACIIWSLGPGRLKLMLKNDVKTYASNRPFNWHPLKENQPIFLYLRQCLL
jgi:hypothetical protein